jgi:DUF4097 and DUF4098 domain-containing protein YvlB
MQKTFEVSGPVELDIRLAAGTIEIDPTLDGRVEIELTADDDESQRLIDDARVELTERHGRPSVLVDVPQKRGFSFGISFGRSGISCRVRCPEESAVQVRSKSADVLVRGTTGALNVATASGDLEADRVTGGVNVKSASGDTTVREIGGALNVQTASGDIEIDVVRGPANVATASGDVTIGEAYDNVNANTVSGDQSHGAVMRGNVTAQSVSGDVEIAVRRGSQVYLDCTTVSGDTNSDLDVSSDAPAGDGPQLELRARTVSGDITIRRAPAPAADPQEVHT